MTSFYLPSESKIGAGWMAHRLANELSQRGHAVTMVSPATRPSDAHYEHRRIELSGRLRVAQWGWQLGRFDLAEFDVLHSHGDDHLVRRGAVPAHIRTLHGSCFDEAIHATGAEARVRMLALGLTELVSAVRVPEVVGVSENAIRWFPWLQRVIPNGVDLASYHATDDRQPNPTILFVGTYRRRKRGALLHKVFLEYVRPRVPNATLWMVCTDAPPAPGVEVLGRISDAELEERYRRAWVFCLPSSYEGFGVPYIEAMASGTPVVATPNLGAREVLQDGRLGVLAPDAQLGRSLVQLLVDGDRRRDLAEAASLAVGRYDWSEIASAYEDLYREALSGRTHAA